MVYQQCSSGLASVPHWTGSFTSIAAAFMVGIRIPVAQVRKLQPSMTEQFASGHRASEQQSQDVNLGCWLQTQGSFRKNALLKLVLLPAKHIIGFLTNVSWAGLLGLMESAVTSSLFNFVNSYKNAE